MIFTKDLKALSTELKEEFNTNEPFPHIVIDGLFDPTILKLAKEEIQHARGSSKSYNDKYQIKKGIEGKQLITSGPENIKAVLKALNSDEFLEFLKNLTDISDLLKDDTFRGGGIHHIPPGGKLGIHIDFSRPKWNRNVYRRVNTLLYLNEDWEDSWNGHLELWDNSVSNGGKCIKKLSPDFNRLVIFGTKKESWHGHPVPLSCPEDRARQSFAAYYYSNTPSDDLEEHSTVFK